MRLLGPSIADVNAATKRGQTALMFAVSSGHPSVVLQLLANGANVQAKDASGFTALDMVTEGKVASTSYR